MLQDTPFWNIRAGDVAVIGTMVISAIAVYSTRKKDSEAVISHQATQHAENREKLAQLLVFTEAQREINILRDAQMSTA
jgi:hypothetical protein